MQIQLGNDNVAERDETIEVFLSLPDGDVNNQIGERAQAVIVVQDDESQMGKH